MLLGLARPMLALCTSKLLRRTSVRRCPRNALKLAGDLPRCVPKALKSIEGCRILMGKRR